MLVNNIFHCGNCRNCYFFTKSYKLPNGIYSGWCHRFIEINDVYDSHWCGEFFPKNFIGIEWHDDEEG